MVWDLEGRRMGSATATIDVFMKYQLSSTDEGKVMFSQMSVRSNQSGETSPRIFPRSLVPGPLQGYPSPSWGYPSPGWMVP